MKKHLIAYGLTFLAAFTLLSVSNSAPAADAPILLHLSVEKAMSGKNAPAWTALTAAVQPGDELRYTVQVRNRGMSPVRNVIVTQPIPAGMSYHANSAQGSPLFSLDGKSFSEQPTVGVHQADGTVQTRPASSEAYRALRWRFAEVAAGAVQSVTYQVKVR